MKRQTVDRVEEVKVAERWSPLALIGFRFAFIYLGLFSLASQISGSLLLIPGTGFRGFGPLWPLREITLWVQALLFNVTDPFVFDRNSGETLFYWAQTLWILIFAVAVTAVWT